MNHISLKDLIIRVLEEVRRPLSAEEIWECAKQKGYDTQLSSIGKTPPQSINAHIYVNIKEQHDTRFYKIGSRPVRFGLKDISEIANDSPVSSIIIPDSISVKNPGYKEQDLHPLMAYVAYNALEAYTKTINHNISNKKTYGEWVHPDMVGCYFPLKIWKDEVLELSKTVGNNSLVLYSFELKKELNMGNLRESFFQTVSNSSWANEGYLVAAEISQSNELRSELQRLSTSFGIGVINIDRTNPDFSVILLPARRRENLDWEMINKLAEMNTDFRELLKRITIDFRSNEIGKELYDKIYDKNELISKFIQHS